MANMTIGAVTTIVNQDRKASRMRKVTFSHTAIGTAAGSATTTFTICGTLLRYVTSGGDADWDLTFNDGVADIYAIEQLTATATSKPFYMADQAISDDESHYVLGIPLVGTLTCSTAGIAAAGGGTVPSITVLWEESD
tara:strand:+ start:994 stop:1407 length:414 start_codon:yes stop_codon:yes gene_type:complete